MFRNWMVAGVTLVFVQSGCVSEDPSVNLAAAALPLASPFDGHYKGQIPGTMSDGGEVQPALCEFEWTIALTEEEVEFKGVYLSCYREDGAGWAAGTIGMGFEIKNGKLMSGSSVYGTVSDSEIFLDFPIEDEGYTETLRIELAIDGVDVEYYSSSVDEVDMASGFLPRI